MAMKKVSKKSPFPSAKMKKEDAKEIGMSKKSAKMPKAKKKLY